LRSFENRVIHSMTALPKDAAGLRTSLPSKQRPRPGLMIYNDQ